MSRRDSHRLGDDSAIQSDAQEASSFDSHSGSSPPDPFGTPSTPDAPEAASSFFTHSGSSPPPPHESFPPLASGDTQQATAGPDNEEQPAPAPDELARISVLKARNAQAQSDDAEAVQGHSLAAKTENTSNPLVTVIRRRTPGICSLDPDHLAEVRSGGYAEIATLSEVCLREFDFDAHMVPYVAEDEDGELCPFRVNKPGLERLEATGGGAPVQCMFFDLDLKDEQDKKRTHASRAEVDAFVNRLDQAQRTGAIVPLWGWNSTRHGWRFIVVLDQPVPARESEALIHGIFNAFCHAGFDLDAACRSWNHIFRAPKTVREDDGDRDPFHRSDLFVQSIGGQVLAVDDCPREQGKQTAAPVTVARAPDGVATCAGWDAIPSALRARAKSYYQAIVDGELEKVRTAEPQTSNNTFNNAALRIGHLVGAELYDEDEVSDLLREAAEGRGVDGIEATLRSGMTAGIGDPEDIVGRARLWRGQEQKACSFVDRLSAARRSSIDRTMPNDDEVFVLTTRNVNGRSCATAGKAAIKKRISDLPVSRLCFDEAPICRDVEERSRNDLIEQLRDLLAPMVTRLAPEEQFTPQLVFALVHGAAQGLGEPDWREDTWECILELWDAAEAELEARAAQAREHRASVENLRERILLGQRRCFDEPIPDDRDEAHEWSSARLMFKSGSDVYLIGCDGYLSPRPYQRDQLPRAIKVHGIEDLIPTSELRGKSTHALSGQEIITRARPWAVSKINYRVGLDHPLLERDGEQYVIVLPQYPLAGDEPQFAPDIDDWLNAVFGDRYGAVCDWLATIPEVSLPTRALVIAGPPGMGKDMLPIGCAQVFKDPEFSRGRAFDRFNPTLAKNPVTFFDEGLPLAAHGGSVSEKLRETISGGTMPVEAKGKDVRYIETRPRTIIATNDLEKVVGVLTGEGLNAHSKKAVEARILAVSVSKFAGSYLDRLGNWKHTQHWCNPKRRLFAKHVLWLHQERIARLRDAGTRFLGQPSTESLLDNYVYDDPKTIAFVETVCRLVHRQGDHAALVSSDEDEEPGLYLQRSALESPQRGLVNGRSAPSPKEIEDAGERAGLLLVPPPKSYRKLKGRWASLNSRAWRTVIDWPLVHAIAQRNGCEHLEDLEQFLVAIGVLDTAEYGSTDDPPQPDDRPAPTSIFSRRRAQ